MITTREEGYENICPFSPTGLRGCRGGACMAWRTIDGDLEHGFCGMVPVLPYILREDTVQCGHTSSAEIIGLPTRVRVVGSGETA